MTKVSSVSTQIKENLSIRSNKKNLLLVIMQAVFELEVLRSNIIFWKGLRLKVADLTGGTELAEIKRNIIGTNFLAY